VRAPTATVVALLLFVVGCQAQPEATDTEDVPVAEDDADPPETDPSDASDPASDVEDEELDEPPPDDEPLSPSDELLAEEPSGDGTIAPYAWDLTGLSPDGRHLVVATMHNDCPRFEGWEHLEEPDRVTIVARMWQPDGSPGCDDVGNEQRTVIELEEPLGDRELIGCLQDDCLTGSFTSGAGSFGLYEVAAAEDTLVVNAGSEQWSLDPDDGSERFRWSDIGRGMLHARAGSGVAVVYDGNLGMQVVDTDTGETRFDVTGRWLGFAGDVFVSCRQRDEGDAEDVQHVTEAHDIATGELRWDVPVGCHDVLATDGEVVSFGGRAGGQRPDLHLVVGIADGDVRARVEVGPNAGTPVLHEDEVFLYYRQGEFIAIDTTDGTVRDLDATGRPLGVAEGHLIVDDDSMLQGRSPDDAEVRWEHPIEPGQQRVFVAGGAVIVTDGPTGEVARLDAGTGDERWTAEVGRSYDTDVALNDDAVFVATSTAAVALDLATGERRWWVLTVDLS
jgi:outer membrane protein assembly factor BamB